MPTIDPNAGNSPAAYRQMLSQLHSLSSGTGSAPPPPPAGDSYVSSSIQLGGGNTTIQTETVMLGQDLRGLLTRIADWLKAHNPFHPQPATPAPAPAAPAPAPAPAAPATYTVKPGDSLSAIARSQLGDPNRWREIYDANRDQISNPNVIYPGQVLKMPGGSTPAPQPSSPPPASKPGSTGEPWSPGGGQLQGSDTSNWQSGGTFDQAIQGDQWAAIKASEGTGYTDPSFKARWDLLGQKVADGSMKLRMAYCFLDKGDGTGQAKHFLDVVGVNGPLPAGTRLALDWEADALNDPNTLRDAANYVHQVTGTWPVIYVQGSKMSVAQSTVPDAPMWEAAWGPNINKNVPFVQYSDGPGFDHDVFNGDANALAKFAGYA